MKSTQFLSLSLWATLSGAAQSLFDLAPAAEEEESIPLHFTFSSAVGYDSSVQEAFAARLSHEDPSAALAWAETLPSAEREQAILGVTQAWLRNDREAVEAWLETLPIRDQERILIGLEQDRGRLGRESIDGTPCLLYTSPSPRD